jgi:hypothetical protein
MAAGLWEPPRKPNLPPQIASSLRVLPLTTPRHSQHYNKKLRHLDPATLGLAGDAAANPSTPVRSSAAKKRKAPATTTTTTTATTPKTPRATAAAARTAIKAAAASPSWSPSASPEPAVKATAARDRKKKKEVVPRAVFPNLRKSVSAAAPAASSADEDAEGEDEDDWEQREVPSKKVKRLEESEVEGEIEE